MSQNLLQDFSGQNLQERNFKGQDLTGANFSHADIRGANFSNAILIGANFSHAKAGLTDKWRKILIAITLLVAGGVGSVAATGSAFVGYFLATKYTRFLTYPDIIYLIVVIAFIILIIFTSKEIKPIFALTMGIAGVFTIVASFSFGLGINAIGFWGLPVLFYITGVFFGLAFSLTLAEVAGGAFNLVMIVNLGFSASIVIDLCNPKMKTALSMAYMLLGFPPAFAEARIATIVGALCGIYTTTYISGYLSWRTLRELNESDRWLMNVVVERTAIKGTNFQGSNLTDANFHQATLENTNFTEANLTRVWFHQAQKLNYASVKGTILEKPLIRDLLVSGDGYQKSYIGANLKEANLKEANLKEANLKEADLTGAILREACLEFANLTLAKIVGTDFTEAQLTGACVEKCNITSGNLNSVDCRFIYLLEHPKEGTDNRERRPNSGEFTPGDFTRLFQEILTINEREVKAIAERKTNVNLVILNLGAGNFEEGFPAVIAQIWKGDNRLPTQHQGALLPAPEIFQIYHSWQLQYNNFVGASRLNKDSRKATIGSDSSLDKLSEELDEKLNKWLNKEEFSPINIILREIYDRSDEIQIAILSENIYIRQLPWHLWDFFNRYRKAEIALSPPYYDKNSRTTSTRNKIRILSILGDDEGININQDRQILAQLDAEIIFVVKPNRQELNQYLWDEQGWDILCFSGHSSSEMDDSNGWIYINDADKVTISELRNGLTTAIERGLQIAIFNSCDGLGLANQLASLHIPQIIVMREPVPDMVAQEFLKHFLNGFAGGKSFYLAVREAREKLQSLEDHFPCASWLPVIFQNPAEIPPTWNSLRNNS